MTRAPKATFPNQIVPAWALNDVSRLSSRSSPKKLAPNKGGLLQVDEAAIHLNVSEKTVRRLIVAGNLKVIRIGRLVRIERREIERFLAAATSPADKTQKTHRGGWS